MVARGAPTDWGPGPPGRPAQRRTPAPESIGGWAEPGPRCVALRVRLLICSAAGDGGGGGSEESGQVRTDWPRFPGLPALIDISTGPQAPPLCAALPPLGRASRSALGAQFCPPLPELCRASLPSPSSSLHSPPVLSSPLPLLRPPHPTPGRFRSRGSFAVLDAGKLRFFFLFPFLSVAFAHLFAVFTFPSLIPLFLNLYSLIFFPHPFPGLRTLG